MRVSNVIPALVLSLVPAALYGQTASGTVGAQATVQSAVAFQTPVSNLDFGVLTPGTPVTIAPASGTGAGVIGLQYNTPATVTVGTLTLAHASGGTIATTLSCAQAATGGSATPTAFTCSTGYTTTMSANVATQWYMYIGGQIAGAATTAAPAGDYTGTVTLTATFSTF